MVSPAERPSRREHGKAERRGRILSTARQLIQESGDVSFSMRGLAEHAGVSVMTLYNLVGSQQDILLRILIEDMVTTTIEREAMRPVDPLDEMFHMVPFIRAAFSDQFAYRRTIILSLFQKGSQAVRLEVRNLYLTGWQRILEAAKTQGLVRASVDIPIMLLVIDSVYTTNIFSLSAGDVDDAVFEARAQFGFAVALAAIVTRAHAGRVTTFLKACQTQCALLEPNGSFVAHDLPRSKTEPGDL